VARHRARDRRRAAPGHRASYGYGGPDAGQILHAVPQRIQVLLDWIPAAAAAGDQGMAHLMTLAEPGRSAGSLAGLIERIPAIARQLA
jgi:hypothetical protein